MKKVAGAFSPVLAVERNADKPLHRQIYDGYREMIVGGLLRAGQKIPSSRALASELRISRIPVLNAYSQLLAEGYFESRQGAGTFVSSSLPDQSPAIPLEAHNHNLRKAKISSGPRQVSRRAELVPPVATAPWVRGRGAFGLVQLAFDHFPFQIWSRLVSRHCLRVHASSLNYSHPMGLPELREALAAYLRTARAVNCDAHQIMIVNGSQQALDITSRVLLDPDSRVWMEEPGYLLARSALAMSGAQLVPVPVDQEGLDVAAGIRRCRQARAAYVTPSHQYPLGVTMSASRRLQLLDWAQSAGAWIIEDDYDSEYRYETMPIASLQGMDRNARVIYIGTFSKTLFPSLRLGYLVIPPDLVERFQAVRHATDIFPSHLYQAVLADFISDGHFARHIRKTRLLYKERRNALVQAIREHFGSYLEIGGAEAGMHLLVTLPEGLHDREIAMRAAAQQLWLWPLSSSYMGKQLHQGFILGFAGTTASDIPKAVLRLRQLITPMSSAASFGT